ncbi:hypothetical protein A2W24_07115 [Microgenomates group bacterium RBG_16_45_19]|nr:MAG: hypothetical protein A2W24_07115 [Microgenomates group bacterium RBG_16_45_19]
MIEPTQDQKNLAGKHGGSAWVGFVVGLIVMGLMVVAFFGGAAADRLVGLKQLDQWLPGLQRLAPTGQKQISQTILNEESAVVGVAERVSPSVVTVAVTTQRQRLPSFFMDPFGMFGNRMMPNESELEPIQQDIGSGFVVDQQQGLIVTNKHVVSSANAKYKVIGNDDKEFEVVRIYRDPVNDLAILKVADASLPAIDLGDSDTLKVGQFVVAIGTALGEFRHTVTTGVVSGLGRGIEAGDGLGGAVEALDNVIQTDAAINPGNSGGPLLNSLGQVIGVNVAIASGSENIGFAIPINVVKQSLANFNETGQFDRPFLGVQYQMISQEAALMNEVPAGAYVRQVVDGSAAAEAGLEAGDIITKLNGKSLKDAKGGLAEIINSFKINQEVKMDIYRDGKTMELTVMLKPSEPAAE